MFHMVFLHMFIESAKGEVRYHNGAKPPSAKEYLIKDVLVGCV
jgi:hypothetical protein